MIEFILNGKPAAVDASGDTPLLWVLREDLELTGTKFGCGAALCGTCTVHINDEPQRSCVIPVSAVAGKNSTLEVTRTRIITRKTSVLH